MPSRNQTPRLREPCCLLCAKRAGDEKPGACARKGQAKCQSCKRLNKPCTRIPETLVRFFNKLLRLRKEIQGDAANANAWPDPDRIAYLKKKVQRWTRKAEALEKVKIRHDPPDDNKWMRDRLGELARSIEEMKEESRTSREEWREMREEWRTMRDTARNPPQEEMSDSSSESDLSSESDRADPPTNTRAQPRRRRAR